MFDRIDPKLLPYLDSGARQSLQSGALSVDDHEALLEEAKRRRGFVEASIPEPSLDNLREIAHSDILPRFHVLSVQEDLRKEWHERHRAEAIRKGNETGWRELASASAPKPEPPERPKTERKPQSYHSGNPMDGVIPALQMDKQKLERDQGTTKPEDIVRADGYTNRQVVESFEKRYLPKPMPKEPQRFTRNEMWTEVKQHRGWYVLAFLLGGLPVGIGTVWPILTHETVPEWLAENGWPRLSILVSGWVAIALIIAVVIVARSYLAVKRKRLEHRKD